MCWIQQWIQFPPLNNIKKVTATFYLTIITFFYKQDIKNKDINSHRETDMFSELLVYLTIIKLLFNSQLRVIF